VCVTEIAQDNLSNFIKGKNESSIKEALKWHLLHTFIKDLL
jgi:hypothetical protein